MAKAHSQHKMQIRRGRKMFLLITNENEAFSLPDRQKRLTDSAVVASVGKQALSVEL